MNPSSKAIHGRSAMLTVFRLQNSQGLIDDEVPAALKITLQPSSVSTDTLSPKMKSRLKSYMSDAKCMELWRSKHDRIAESTKPNPLKTAKEFCISICVDYWKISKRRLQRDRYYCWLLECVLCSVLLQYMLRIVFGSSGEHRLKSPKIGLKAQRQYYLRIGPHFVVHCGFTTPYSMCGAAQTRHPDELALSSTKVLSLSPLAMDCQRITPQSDFLHCACFCNRYVLRSKIDCHCSGT